MDANLAQITQAMINFLGWFMIPFTIFVVVEWLTRLFNRG